MNDDELRKLWQQQPLRQPAISQAQVVSAMQKQTTQLRRILDARDLRELVACAILIVIFACFFFFLHAREPIVRLGDLIIIGGTIFISWKLVYTRRANPPAPPGATTVEALRAELNSVRAQSRLLGSVLWWYLLPLAIGLFVSTWGTSSGNLGGKIGYTIFVIALYAFIYWLNQRARATQLLPVEAQLESLLHAAETSRPFDEIQVANLRPIILSMAAADRVRTVEFKVAFWEIALWGEIGFVGMWFFLMLGLTLDNPNWKTKGRTLEPLPQTVRVEETNRYSIVARNVIDLLNAGDFAAIQALFNPQMDAALPPREASEFFTKLATGSGKIQTFEGPTGNGYLDWTAFRLHCQRGELTMSLSLDADNRISGIHFRPAPRSSESIGSFVRRLFSWQHLVWLPPFFLAGLLYSWLMQKLTERALGISILGIHLCKGQTLILWDEIKEVRPFRFLHVRNLWLIKESGEKTLMHWSPLERHCDLKMAVENFAPANHPIRKYLSLLTRI
jgi:hypothetical protein